MQHCLQHTGGWDRTKGFDPMAGRADGINWAVTFNKDAPGAGQEFVVMLDAPLHKTADQIKDWPTGDLYPTLSL